MHIYYVATSPSTLTWPEIDEERDDTSVVLVKRCWHRYPGLGNRTKLHWGSLVSSADPGCAARELHGGGGFLPPPRAPAVPPISPAPLVPPFSSRASCIFLPPLPPYISIAATTEGSSQAWCATAGRRKMPAREKKGGGSRRKAPPPGPAAPPPGTAAPPLGPVAPPPRTATPPPMGTSVPLPHAPVAAGCWTPQANQPPNPWYDSSSVRFLHSLCP